ncbi:hypothetical protein V6Z11_A05G399300 [Gossypium hirsutum]
MWFFLHYFASLLSTCGPKYPGDEVRKTAGYIVEWGTKIYSAKDVFSSIQSETIMQKSCRAFSSRDGTSTPVFQFSAHSYWIPACKWHNTSPFHLLSSSYDGKVMLWDLRTAEKPTTLDCGPRTICRRRIMTSSYLYECLWEVLQQRIRMITCS